MLSISCDGYVRNHPKKEQTSVGQYIELSIRVAILGDKVAYVTSRFYAKKIWPVERFIKNGDYITMSGMVTGVRERKTKDGKDTYTEIYLKDACYTLPPYSGDGGSYRPSLPSGGQEGALDTSALWGDD